MSSLISLKKVTKSYKLGDDVIIEALRGVDLEIKKGEFVAIVGPSGSGKSTLMHMIGILDKPSTGSVFLDGREIGKLKEEELAVLRNKYIGFVFQAFNLLAKTTATDNVELPLIYSGVKKEERKKRAIAELTQVGLGERLDHTPSQLSGGQQQRVAIARALVTKPRLILADEPTGNLDSKSGVEIIALLKSLNKSGNTIVLVTHDMETARNAKRIVSIKDGLIVSDLPAGRQARNHKI